jgi:acyl-coenzyme A synthetase/AMP-(fatty) acid ligase
VMKHANRRNQFNVIVLKAAATKRNGIRSLHWWDELTKGSDQCPETHGQRSTFLLTSVRGSGHHAPWAGSVPRLTADSLKPRADRNQIFWCTADISWVTGHSTSCTAFFPIVCGCS